MAFLLTESVTHQLKLRFFDQEAQIKSDSNDFINRFSMMYRRFLMDGPSPIVQPSTKPQRCNQKTSLLPPFARERGSVIDYPHLIPPFARGDIGGCKKLSETRPHENREKKFLKSNTIQFILLTNPDNRWGKPVLILDGEVWPISSSRFLEGYAYEKIIIGIITRIQSHLLIHAGVVSWRGQGIVLVADTMHGKTTLVLELVRRGFKFLSDEFAAMGRTDRRIYPFPRSLWIRKGTLKLVGFPGVASKASTWLDKLILDIEEIQPDSLGGISPINHIVILKDPTEAGNATRDNSRHELNIFVDRLDDSFLTAVGQVKGVVEVLVDADRGYPRLRLHTTRTTPVLSQIELLCREYQILVLDIIKGAVKRPTFESPAQLKAIPNSYAVMELLRRFQAGYKSELLKNEFGGSSARLFMELSNLVGQANCYQLSVGPLQEMADLVCGLAGA